MTALTTGDARRSTNSHLTDGELTFLIGARDDAARPDSGTRPRGAGSAWRTPWASADERAAAPAWTAHLAGCAGCRERLAVLDRRARRLSARIAELELPADFRRPTLHAAPARWHGRWHGRGWVRAAAVLLVVLAPLLLAPPMRAWALGWVSAGWTRVATRRSAPAAPPARSAAPVPAGAGSRIRFTPGSDEITIELVAAQARGALIFSATSETEVAFEVVDGTGQEVPLVHEGGLTVRNARTSVASYRVVLPPAARRVRVSVGTHAPVLIERARIGRELRVPLW